MSAEQDHERFFNDDDDGDFRLDGGESLHHDFHSVYEERPFRCCTSCGEALSDLGETYQVTKAFHGQEVIMEYAICAPCQQNMLKELSEESIATLSSFQIEHSKAPENDADLGYYRCEFCLTSREEAIAKQQHYSMAALCYALQMIERPLFVCESCMMTINEKMSEQTRRRWRDFVDTHFPGVPADALPDPHVMPML